jgi:hypothetical protein
MKKLVIALLALSAFSAHAAEFEFDCAQVRTTAEESVATTRLKLVTLVTNGSVFSLSTNAFGIKEIDERLLAGGAILTHVEYGGYFTNDLGEVFRCLRPID